MDCTADPFIGGGYTLPSPEGKKAREALATPHGAGRVTFCGEATNPNVDVTIQACMVSGRRAAEELNPNPNPNPNPDPDPDPNPNQIHYLSPTL